MEPQIISRMACSLSCILSFTLMLLEIQSSAFAAEKSGNISIGQTLSAATNGSTWVSPRGNFAFGFHPFNTSHDLFLLAIWYAKIPDTIVWYANGGNPVPEGSTVQLDANDGLVLSDPKGIPLWNTSDELSGNRFGSYGFMNDTGNFVLKDSSTDDTVWESFQHPTDTLLPTQSMEVGGVVTSCLSETNFTKGRFQLSLQQDGNLVLNTRDPATDFSYLPYYASHTDDTAYPANNAGYRVVYDESGNMSILIRNGSKVTLTPENIVSATDYYHRATLNFDGVLTWYYHPRSFSDKTDVAWSKTWAIPDNICRSFGVDIDSGACGYNNICSLGDDQRPRCECPSNFSLVDPNDSYGSCKPDFRVYACEEHGQGVSKGEYKLMQLKNTDWPYCDYARVEPSTAEDCKKFCLNDCLCAAVAFDGKTCWKKKLPLSHGRRGNEESRTTWIKVGNEIFLDGQFKVSKVNKKLNTAVPALLGGFTFLNFILLSAIGLGIYYIYQKKKCDRLNRGRSTTLRGYSYVNCFSYQELKEATNGFKEEIGRGAFGVVYKGIIGGEAHPTFVAVKKLDRISSHAGKEFKNEVNVIGQTHHKNLVRFIGFCKEEDQQLLVYEYMRNGTLADYLFGDFRPSWSERNRIALGVASGLLYLHEECSTQIIHCDIKPQNILLDEHHNARISDFGLAKLLELNQSQTFTVIRGTKGYVAPEWFRNKPVTVKVDVYSFGVLLLEIICCRKSVCTEIIGEETAILTDWAFDCYQSSTLDTLVNDDMEALNDRLRLERFVKVALWCIQEDPSLRPTMRMVTQMLEGLAEVPNPPCNNSFSIMTET